MRAVLTTFILLLFLSLQAQQPANLFDFKETPNIKVLQGTDSLTNPWAGGLNYAQINTIDIDLDGTQDLVVYDKNSQRVLPFIGHAQSSSVIFKYAPQYRELFPVPSSWMIIKDYDCDGKKDIFYNTASNVRILKNTSNGSLSFTDPIGNSLKTMVSGSPTNLYVSAADMPTIADVDDDGDLDIFTFNVNGNVVAFNENLTSCGLNFNYKEACWGYFSESGIYRAVNLDDCIPQKKKVLHSGSSMLLLDLNDDGVQDLLLGNVNYSDITALYNTGSKDSAHFTSQDTLFPTYTKSIVVDQFPALFYADVTNDGISDLIASPYSYGDGFADRESVHLYTNLGTETNPLFNFTKSDFLQDEMIDLGSGAVPRLVDLNADRKLDLVVSNDGEYTGTGSPRHYYHYYKNTGTFTQPQFTLVDTNFVDIASYNLGKASIPAFGDLDADGDPDMIVGDENGQLHYFTNSSLFSPSFTLQTAGVGGIDVGQNAAPFLFDLDSDGDLDLIVGNKLGKLHYYTNSSATAPSFTLKSDFFGSVNTYFNNSQSGSSVPYAFRQDSVVNLFVGAGNNGVFQFDSVLAANSLPGQLTGAVGTQNLISSDFEETPFGTEKRNGRNQFLFRASELKAAGLKYGQITAISFDVVVSNDHTMQNGFTIRMKLTTDSVLTDFEDPSNMQKVNLEVSKQFTNGLNRIELYNPLLWDGNSNLLVEICFSGNPLPPNIPVKMSNSGFDSYAIGDLVSNSLSTIGCNQPFKTVVQKRPNVLFEITPSFVNTAVYYPETRRSAPALGDLNQDGFVDMIVGNISGGLNYYEGKIYDVSLPELAAPSPGKLTVYPNPGNGSFTVLTPNSAKSYLKVFDLTGKLVLQKSLTQKTTAVEMHGMPSGIYLFRMENGESVLTQKVILR